MKSRSKWILLVVGAVLIVGTLALVNYLNRPPVEESGRIRFDPAAFERGMEQLKREKFRCEEEIQTALKRDRPRFEAIVNAVEKQQLSEGQSEQYSFPKGGSPDQLSKLDEGFNRAQLGEFCEKNTLIRAYRRGGVLFLKVVICEMGHAGTYAVMYSSKELTMKEIEDQLVPHAVERLDPHWWAVIEWY